MAKKPETKFKEKVVDRFWDEFGPDAYVVKIQQVALRGVPDLFICIRSKLAAWELKATEKDLATPLQEKVLEDIRIAGGLTAVVHPGNFEKELKILKDWVGWTP